VREGAAARHVWRVEDARAREARQGVPVDVARLLHGRQAAERDRVVVQAQQEGQVVLPRLL
jgi:hypothetical protein